jgi:hypothetical protein
MHQEVKIDQDTWKHGISCHSRCVQRVLPNVLQNINPQSLDIITYIMLLNPIPLAYLQLQLLLNSIGIAQAAHGIA